MDEGFQKGSNRLSLPLSGSSKADPKRVSLPVTTITPVKRCDSPQSKRVVLKELCANTLKKLSFNNKVTPSKSGSATPSSKPPPASPGKEHEANVQFAREFVEELVEKLPGDSVPALPEKEDTTRYSVAFSDISAFSETSLPDLLQPEAQYKKQADTDTDTTDYESAVESDALSLNASLLDRSDPLSSPDVLDAAHSPSADLTPRVQQPADPETFEDAEASFGEDRSTPNLDISALCLDVGKLSLGTPQRPAEESTGGDSFLVTLNADFTASSTDTSFNTTECDLPGFVLGESFIEKSLHESSIEPGLLSTTFDAAPSAQGSTEYNLEIIQTLEFDLEKPDTEEAKPSVEAPVSCDVDPVSPIVGSEKADLTANQSGEIESLELQATVAQEALESEPQIVPAEEIPDTATVLQPLTETNRDNSVTEAGINAACEVLQKLQLVTSEVGTPQTVANLSSQEEQSTVSEPEAGLNKSVPTLDENINEDKPSETFVASQDEQSTVSEPEAGLNKSVPPVDENTTEYKPSETLVSSQEQQSTVDGPEVVTNELLPPVGDVPTEVLPAPEPDLSSSAVEVTESASIVDNNTSGIEQEVSQFVDHRPLTSVVDPQESTCVVELTQSEPVIESSVVSVQELANASSALEPEANFVEATESETSANSSCIEGNKSEEQDLTIVVTELRSETFDELPVAKPQELIGETVQNNPIVVPITVANEEPQASVSVALISETERALSRSPIPVDEPELLAVSSEPVNFDSRISPEPSGRKNTISPSFIATGENPSVKRVSPALLGQTVSVVAPVPTYQQPSAVTKKATDVIDPVGAVWSRDKESASCFSSPPRFPKEEQVTPPNPDLIQIHTVAPTPKAAIKQEFFSYPSGDPFSPIPFKTEPKGVLKSLEKTTTIEDQSLNDLREICQRQQRELDNQQFSSDLFGDSTYNSLALASIAAEAAKVSEDIHNASIDQIEFEMDENVNPVPLDKKWLSERGGAGAKVEARETAKSRNILGGGGGDGFTDSLDKQNKNIMTASIDAQTNQSEAGPEIALQDAEETFADSEGFDFLSAKASTGPSDRLVRESLYTKFDPLATPQVAAAPAPAARHAPLPMPPKFAENDNKVSTPSGQLIQLAPTPVTSTPPRSSTPSANEGPTETNTPKNSAARALVDRLISLSPASRNVQASPVKPPPPVVKSPAAPTMEQMSEELMLLRELLSEEEMGYKKSVAALQEKLKDSEVELQAARIKIKEAEEREQKLTARLGEKVSQQKQFAAVMCEYEKTISKLVGEKDNEKMAFIKERELLVKEKDVALGHLTNIEIAFSDVHQKYERCKTVVEAFKSNEDVLRESLSKYEATILKQEKKYDMLKAHAMTQLENANQELDAVRKNQSTESAKLKAMLKKSELKTSSLEEMLDQKVKENLELASICDDLIAKVGT